MGSDAVYIGFNELRAINKNIPRIHHMHHGSTLSNEFEIYKHIHTNFITKQK